MKTTIYLTITFILTILLESIIMLNPNLIFLTPFFLLTSVPILYYIVPKKSIYILIILIWGLITDLKTSNIFLFETLFILIIAYLTIIIFNNKEPNLIKILLFSLITIIVYSIIKSTLNFILLKEPFSFLIIGNQIKNLLLTNLFYCIFSYFTIIKSRKKT